MYNFAHELAEKAMSGGVRTCAAKTAKTDTHLVVYGISQTMHSKYVS